MTVELLVDRIEYVRDLVRRSIALKTQLLESHVAIVASMAHVCTEAVAAGRKILFCGNGGSAADAQHLAAELLVRLRPDVNRAGVPAIALAMDSSAMTACGNDFSYDMFYERMVMTLGNRGDVLIALTTSGKSPNIVRALAAARAKDIRTLGFLGGSGGAAIYECDIPLVIPSYETGRIQECHITLGHALMELIENDVLKRESIVQVE